MAYLQSSLAELHAAALLSDVASHPLLHAFQNNTPAFGAWLYLPGSVVARTVAQASPNLSWVMLDCEHGLTPLQPGAAECIQAIQGIGAHAPSAIVRIPATGASDSTSWQIKYALDAGARGVLVPMVSTAEQAAGIVADSKFPTSDPGVVLPYATRRGVGSPFAASHWGMSPFEYAVSANKITLVMVQIETKEGTENAQAIAETPGIDVLFIGPFDLSRALGFPPPIPEPTPEFETVIQNILHIAHAAGKKCGIYCTSGDQAARRAAEGFDMISVTTDHDSLSGAIAGQLKTASIRK